MPPTDRLGSSACSARHATIIKTFLRQHALPFMKEAALFYEDFLIVGPDGKWLFSPSYSPENNPGNHPSQACVNATMDIAVAKELLNNCIAASEALRTDTDLRQRWRAMLAKMPDYSINADGAVKEWSTPSLEDNYAHRHCSDLYALLNGLPAEIATNAPLRKAFQVAAEKRMEFRRKENGGEMAFGLVQLGLAASSLPDSAMSYDVVDWLANNYWNPNITTTHNPKSLFNVDLSGGLPAIVIKMLVDTGKRVSCFVEALGTNGQTSRVEGWNWAWYDERASWTWPGLEGKPVRARIYSYAPKVRLTVNGRNLGEKTTDRGTRYVAAWELPYEPGELVATALDDNGKELDRWVLRTAGKPASIRLTPDRSVLAANAQDLSFVSVELTDGQGVLDPTADSALRFRISGPGTIVGIGNGDPHGWESFQQPTNNAFRGRCLVVVKAGSGKGTIRAIS